MSALSNWSRRFAAWLAQMNAPWFALGVVFFVLLLTYVSTRNLPIGESEPIIRWAGLTLQLLGILTVIWGIITTLRLLNRPTPWEVLKRWIRAFPPWTLTPITGSGAMSAGAAMMKGRMYATHVPSANPTLEDRVRSLEQNQASLRTDVESAHAEIDRVEREGKAALESKVLELRTDAGETRNDLVALGTGSLYISGIGSLWLIVGVFLSTTSVEVARWLQ